MQGQHHFVPQFYLRSWREQNGAVFWTYSRNSLNKIRYRKFSSKAIGFVNDLYSLKPESSWSILNPHPDMIEKVFSRIDEAAASVHKKLVNSGLHSLSIQDKLDWALFLNSLLERTPDRIREIKEGFSENNIKQEILIKLNNSEFLEKINLTALHHNSVLSALVKFIFDENFINYVANMRWATVDIPYDNEHLLTGDAPLVVNGGQGGNPIYALSIAISPRRLLILHKDTEEFDEKFIRTLSVIHNVLVVDQARQYVISSREIKDGPFTKYTKVIQDRLKRVTTTQ